MKSPFPRVDNELVIVRLSRTDWRISLATNPENVLGYIERQRGGRFEVMWMTDPMRWGYAASFREAIAAFDTSARFAGEVLSERAPVPTRARTSRFSPNYL